MSIELGAPPKYGLAITRAGAAVILRKAVAVFVEVGFLSSDLYFGPQQNHVILVASASPYFPGLLVILRVSRLMFSEIICDRRVCLTFNLPALYSNLYPLTDDDCVRLVADDTSEYIEFSSFNRRTRQIREAEVPLLSINHLPMDVPQLDYEYEVFIEIPSSRFRALVMDLRYFGTTVSALVTDNHIMFYTGNRQFFLWRQLGEFSIHALPHPSVSLAFGIMNARAIMNASLLTDEVWLFADGPRVTLNFAIDFYGALMFHFG